MALIIIFSFVGDGLIILQFRFYFEMSWLVFIIRFSVQYIVSDFFQDEIITIESNVSVTLMLTQSL